MDFFIIIKAEMKFLNNQMKLKRLRSRKKLITKGIIRKKIILPKDCQWRISFFKMLRKREHENQLI